MKIAEEERKRRFVSRWAIVVGENPFPQVWSPVRKRLISLGECLPGEYFEKACLPLMLGFWKAKMIHPEARTAKVNFDIRYWYSLGQWLKKNKMLKAEEK